MAIQKIKCPLCNTLYKSKFCASLHLHFHQQQSKASTGLQCSLCKKQFVRLDHFEKHLQCHWYSSPVKSFGEVTKKTDSEFNTIHFYLSVHLFLFQKFYGRYQGLIEKIPEVSQGNGELFYIFI